MESKHTGIVDAAIAYDMPETGQVVIFLINQAIEMKGLNDAAWMDSDWWSPKFLAPIPNETTHDIQIVNPFDVKHPIIIPLK